MEPWWEYGIGGKGAGRIGGEDGGVCVREKEPNHGHQEGREPCLVLQLLFHSG